MRVIVRNFLSEPGQPAAHGVAAAINLDHPAFVRGQPPTFGCLCPRRSGGESEPEPRQREHRLVWPSENFSLTSCGTAGDHNRIVRISSLLRSR